MDKKQFAKVAIAIKSAYPASKILEDNASMDFWFMMLQDIDYKIAETAVMEHICTNIYPPNIAEIRKLCMGICQPKILSFDEAWGVVLKAMSKCGRDDPLKAYSLMDEITSSVVKNLGWFKLCTSENQAADRANFREAYERKVIEIQNQLQLPQFVSQNKLELRNKYVSVIEKKEFCQLEDRESEVKERDSLTAEQLEARATMIEDLKRRFLSGKETE